MRFSDLIEEIDFERMVVGGDSVIHRLDPRVKVLGIFAILFGISAMNHIFVPLLIFISAILVALAIKTPLKTLLMRLVIAPFSIAIVVLLVALFTYGGTHEVASIYGLPIYRESIYFATLLFTRIIASIAVLSVFVTTTQVRDAMEALRWFHMPKTIVDLAMMMLRYIHLLSAESVSMYRAQASRCGFSRKLSYRQKMMNLGTVGGALVLRALKRGERVYRAMIARGYTAKSSFRDIEPMDTRTAVLCIGVLLISGMLVLVDRLVLVF